MENNGGIKDKILSNIIPILFGSAGILLIVFAAITLLEKTPTSKSKEDKYAKVSQQQFKECETKKESYVVDGGTDLYPIGTKIDVELNYYACNKAQRDDVVMIKTPGKEQPLIKYVKMVPGDKYKVVIGKDQRHRIELNGRFLANAKGEEYAMPERKVRMIQLYESNFKNGIKDDIYFVFGNEIAGGYDSTRFGPIMPDRLLGKVLTPPVEIKKTHSSTAVPVKSGESVSKSSVVPVRKQ